MSWRLRATAISMPIGPAPIMATSRMIIWDDHMRRTDGGECCLLARGVEGDCGGMEAAEGAGAFGEAGFGFGAGGFGGLAGGVGGRAGVGYIEGPWVFGCASWERGPPRGGIWPF